MINLTGKVAVVTGGGQGIGLAIATLLADAGASVVVSDVNREAVEEAARNLASRGKEALAVIADVTRCDDVQGIIEKANVAWGQVDILVNNAGITRDGLLIRMKDTDWDSVLAVNLKGAYYCIRAVLPLMTKRRKGRIINISSIAGVMGNVGQTNYAASKAALIGVTKTVAREYASRGITVNAVAPGFIDTEMTRSLPEGVRTNLLKEIPLSRLGVPADVAHAVAFLASDEAGYITGQVIHVNGGMYM